jgi:lysophospholipase L1-like esterase
MAHRTRRGPLYLLAGLVRAVVPASWRARSDSTGLIGATDSMGSTATTDAAGGGRTSDPRGVGAASSLGRLGRRFLPREPHRRELAAMLVLVLAACALSAGLPGAWAAHADSPSPSGRLAVNSVTADPTASASPSMESPSPSPSPTEVPMLPTPPVTDSPTPQPTPTPPPKKATATSKVYKFVALGDSLTYGYGDPGPSWPVRLDAKDAQLILVHNAGVSGDTTADMRARLNGDVFAYNPGVLFIMGGTNDVGRNISATTTIANLKAIVVAAKARGILVVLMTIPPTSYPRMVDAINSLNSQIVNLANSYALIVVDVHGPLSTSDGLYIPKYTSDGLHFSTLGTQTVANTVFLRVQAARF